MLSVSILQSAIHQSKSHQSDQDLLELIDSIVGEELLNRAVGIIEGTGVKYRSTTKKSKYAITAICPPNRLQKLYYCVGDSFQQYVWWNPWICSCARSNDDQILRNNNNNNSLCEHQIAGFLAEYFEMYEEIQVDAEMFANVVISGPREGGFLSS